jgi:deazaflavin-dependent oxidoreductase (nitroreductase family)
MEAGIKRTWLKVIDRTLNKATARLARSGHGPISLIRHRGRKSGKIYETPIMVAPVEGGYMCELTYGDQVAWYRNVVAAGGGDLLYKGIWRHIVAIEPRTPEEGRSAYHGLTSLTLKMLRRKDFRFLREADP